MREVDASTTGRSFAEDRMVSEANEHGITGEVEFLVAEDVFGRDEVKFTDVVPFGLKGKYSLGSRAEL